MAQPASPPKASTQLLAAATAGNSSLVQRLLGRGVNVNALGMNGQTPLSLAEENGHFELAKMIARRGALA